MGRQRSSARPDPRKMSQAELDAWIDELIRRGEDDGPYFDQCYSVWEETE